MKVGQIVNTPDGLGKIVNTEYYGRPEPRYGVLLDDVNRYFYSPAYYFPNELTNTAKAN